MERINETKFQPMARKEMKNVYGGIKRGEANTLSNLGGRRHNDYGYRENGKTEILHHHIGNFWW